MSGYNIDPEMDFKVRLESARQNVEAMAEVVKCFMANTSKETQTKHQVALTNILMTYKAKLADIALDYQTFKEKQNEKN